MINLTTAAILKSTTAFLSYKARGKKNNIIITFWRFNTEKRKKSVSRILVKPWLNIDL